MSIFVLEAASLTYVLALWSAFVSGFNLGLPRSVFRFAMAIILTIYLAYAATAAEPITLEQFGGKANDNLPDDEAMRKALIAALGEIPSKPPHRIELGYGVYLFKEPVEWFPKFSYAPAPQLIGQGGIAGHRAHWGTTLKFTHTDDRPCMRLVGQYAHLEGFGVDAPDTSYCAIELGNDCWPGRLIEPGYKGDLMCNRSSLRHIGTWGARIGISVRGWVVTLDQCKIAMATHVGVRLAGNAMAVRDHYHSIRTGIGIHIEHGNNIVIDGGAIEASAPGTPPRFLSDGGIKIDWGDCIRIENVYMEGHPTAVIADNVHGLRITGLLAYSVPRAGHILMRGSDEKSDGYLLSVTKKTTDYEIETGRMDRQTKPFVVRGN